MSGVPGPTDYGAEDVAAVFGRAADVYDSVIPFFERFGARLVEVADLQPGESVLDVGAGRGATLLPPRARSARRAGHWASTSPRRWSRC